MKKRKIELIIGIACLLVVLFAGYEILSLAGFIQDKETMPRPFEPNSAEQDSRVDAIGTNKVTLAWDFVSDADSYNVYWSTAKGVSKDSANKVSAATNSVTIEGLKSGVKYYFVVTSVNESGESRESEELSFVVK